MTELATIDLTMDNLITIIIVLAVIYVIVLFVKKL